MKIGKVIFAFSAVLLLAWLAVRTFWVVPIKEPCNTFVSEFAPIKTPALEGSESDWVLTVSFTPAADEEATKIYLFTFLGQRIFEVVKTGRRFKATSQNGLFRIRVSSEAESTEVLHDLCFK